MWSLLFLLGAVLNVDCYYTTRERLAHGRRLTIKIPKETERLEFKPVEEASSVEIIWSRTGLQPTKGRLTGSSSSSSSSDRRWELQKVVFDDEGTYVLRDHWHKETKSILLAVTTEHKYINRVAGEDLNINLEGSNEHEATLVFTGEAANITLVRDGAAVGNDLADYAGRVKISSYAIIISYVNTSEVGRYRLFDRRDRLVSVTKMTLVDAHEDTGSNPLLALLLLLGIPAGICCCCRKKIFRKKATTTATHIVQAEGPPPGGPPSYNSPSTPMVQPGSGGQVFYHGPTPTPNAGYAPGYPAAGGPMPPQQNPGYPGQPYMPPGPGFQPGCDPQNPAYPPPIGPGGPPQYNGPPTNQYNGPPPPNQYNGPPPPNQYNPAVGPGYTPVTYSAPPPNQMDAPAAPLLTPPQPQDGQPIGSAPPSDILHSSGTASQFQMDSGKNFNFL
ncbi:cleavage and polyadenylation specificity factor subunit 6 [Clupea harengus]|uniref:Cleavage and polyadenylation specificity factor subunit 6 n=1 Tax=Clupea harengus TaxID=7950 RepID=A0A6P3W8X2_CLUHA|nr:cleavage and polyadenylation specificity factor subunit 6 [Clupea harengus]XP_031415624.1 cleavage and polyadenylation specificity factor subunit 6 [Clupea harengus]